MSFNPYQSKSESFKRKNPHLFVGEVRSPVLPTFPPPKPPKRIRQSQKPVLNKLEQEWFDYLSTQFYPRLAVRAQAKRYQIGRGVWYKPDVTCTSFHHISDGLRRETAWEVKGPKQMKGIARGMVVLKAAAHCWPEVRFILVWKENGEWKEQIVLP